MANECLTCCNNHAWDLIGGFGLTRFIHCKYRNDIIIRANKRIGNYTPAERCQQCKGWLTIQVPEIDIYAEGWEQNVRIVPIAETRCRNLGGRGRYQRRKKRTNG